MNHIQGSLVAGRYRLGEAIGSGGMGRVWRAHDEVLHRSVALKELTGALHVTDGERVRMLARMRAEARAAARINHSAVVTVHDVLEYDGRPWIVMELVEGRSLADALTEQKSFDPREAARIGLWVLRALRAAHTAGVLHRDVKPGNVLLARDGRVLLTDFGIAQIDGDSAITRTGEVVGSVDYLAPERIRGEDPGPASDLWSLGAMLYTVVSGRSPFRRTSPLMTMQAVVEEEPGEPRNAGALASVISTLLRKDPAGRPEADQVEQRLAEVAEGRATHVAQEYVPTRVVGARPVPAPPGTWPQAVPEGMASVAGAPYPQGSGADTQPPYGPPAAPRRKVRMRVIAMAAALAAVIGGGTAVVVQQWDRDGGVTAQPSVSASAPGSAPSDGNGTDGTGTDGTDGTGGTGGTADTDGTEPRGGIPEGWVRRTDPFGFTVVLPGEDWKRVVFDEETQQVDYTPDGGRHFLRVSVDPTPDYDDAYRHLQDLDRVIGARLVGYQRLGLERRTYRDRDAAQLEYTWTALAKDTEFPGPRRGIDHMYISHDGVEYAIYMASPAADWDTTREQFRTILQGWRES